MTIRRKYSREFKQEAVEMSRVPGVTLKQLGEELGVSAALLGRWRKQLKTDGKAAFSGKASRATKIWRGWNESLAELERNAILYEKRQRFALASATLLTEPYRSA